MVGLSSVPSGVAICRNRNRDERRTKNKIRKKTKFGVATIVYSGKLQKNYKDKTRSAKNQILGSEGDYAWGRY